MKGIWGWCGSAEATDPLQLLQGLGGTNGAPFTSGSLTTVAAEDWHPNPVLVEGKVKGAMVGRPRWSKTGGCPLPDELKEAFLTKGEALLGDLVGPFALILADEDHSKALLAVDRLGIWDLAYANTPKGLIFGPRPDWVAADPRCRKGEVDPQALFDYLYYHVIPRPFSAFEGVFRLRPGEALTWHQGRTETFPYWHPTYPEDRETPSAELEERFRQTLREAVGRASHPGAVGTFLSGGTDSSTITGMLGEVTGRPPRTFAIGFRAEGYDETGYARIAAKRFGAEHHEYFVTPNDVAKAVPEIASAYGQPFGNASVVPTYFCTKLARETGIEVLLGGDGGDELFAGNARYARQWLLSLYEQIPRPLRKILVEPALALPGVQRLRPGRKLASYVQQASLPLPDRLQSYNLLAHLGPERVFTSDFLSQIDPGRPMAELTQEYRELEEYAFVNRLLGLDLKFTLADDDLRKVTRAGELAGIETRFPFLDDEVVTFAGKVPASLKLRGTRLRHFFKQALSDYLPPEILAKEKHGFGLPFGVWLQEEPALRDLARESLDSLRARGIIQKALIDDLTGRRLQEHPSYFGTLTWVLMMMEQWFRSIQTNSKGSL